MKFPPQASGVLKNKIFINKFLKTIRNGLYRNENFGNSQLVF